MKEMTRLLGARHIGSSPYHPQSQGAVESLHKTVNNVVKGLVQEHPEEWEKMLPFAECILRCSPMADLGNRSPYEVVTGLKPKMPVAMVAKSGRGFLPVTEYTVQLQAYMRDTYQAVKRLQTAAHERVEGTLSGHLSRELHVGDAVLVKRLPSGSGYEGPIRFRPSTYPGIYKVSVKISPTTFWVVDFADPNREIPFGQPVNADRLIRLDLPELELMPDQPRKLEGQEDDGFIWTEKRISRLFADGRAYLTNMDGSEGEWCDIKKVKYQYVL